MSKLVECKACSKEIAKGVKKCPSCGKDQRSFFGRHKILTFIGAVVILGGIGSALGGGGETETASTTTSTETAETASNTEAKKEEEKVFAVGEVATQDKLEVAVTTVEEKDSVGNEYLSKAVSTGGTFVAIQYTMKNVTDKPVTFLDFPTVNLVDANGTEYDSDIDASSNYSLETDIDNSKILSDLNPDIQVTGTTVFEISKEKFAQGQWYITIGDSKIQIK